MRALICAIGLACAGCDLAQSAPPPCSAGLPAQSVLLAAPEFSSLRFHRHTPVDPAQQAGSDVWADERFEYKAAVEFGIVRARAPAAGEAFCSDTVSMKLVLPADQSRRTMLRAFVRTIASRSALSVEDLQARVDEALARRSKYRPLAKQGNVAVEAGMLTHPKWGDLFVVSFVAQ